MRISDWSSDVCSSDLARRLARNRLSSSQTRPLRRVRTTRAISNQRIDVPLEPGFGIGSWEFGRSDLRVFRLSRQNHHGGGCCASPIPKPQSPQIGRGSGREREGTYGWNLVGAVEEKKK